MLILKALSKVLETVIEHPKVKKDQELKLWAERNLRELQRFIKKYDQRELEKEKENGRTKSS